MAASTRASLDEYLRYPGKYEPDAEYVDGEIQERPMGQDDHSAWQLAIQLWFNRYAEEWNIRVRPELRVQVAATRFRIPDVSILDRAVQKEQIAKYPPVAVFEVISPEDTIKRMKVKLADYQAMGIPAIFLVDPETGIFERYVDGQRRPCSEFNLPGRGIVFSLSEIAKLVS